MKPTNPNREELLAKRIVETAVRGVKLRYNQNQNKSLADFSITRNGHEVGVLEVTRSTVQEREELRSLIRQNPILERKHCQSYWIIQLSDKARINKLRRYADQYLREIEILGKDEFYCETDHRTEPVRRIWIELGIEAGHKIRSDKPGIGILPPPSGGHARHEYVWEALHEEATKPDNLYKLRKSTGSERHLFIFIDGHQGPAYVSIRGCEPPQNAAKLPLDITHIWAAAEEGHLLYVWKADNKGWKNLTHIVNRNAR